jgi:phage terminase large subunit-like protein
LADLFLEAVRALHQARAKVRTMTPERRAQLVAELGDDGAGEWLFAARDAQLPPADLGWCWLYLGARGTGKSHAAASAIHLAVRAGLGRIHAVAPTAADVWDVLVEGPSGLMKTCGAGPIPQIIRYKRRLEWPNGATCTLFSGEEPDQLRGPQCQLCYIDELAKMRYAEDVFDNAQFGLRLGDKPRMLITTTPRPTAFMKKLIAMEGVSVTTSSTFDNPHLSTDFLKRIRAQYEGTRRGLQELHGAMLLEPADALFEEAWLIHDDVPQAMIEQVTVGVDPSGGADEVGIVVAALLTDDRLAILADRTTCGSPATWGDAVVRASDDFDADDVAVEVNYGGAMATDVVRQAADRAYAQGRRSTNTIRIKEVSASRGKVMRAEPVSLLYERARVLHRHGLEKLEAEMLSFSRDWSRDVDGSPNRLDAAIWALSRLAKIQTSIPIA